MGNRRKSREFAMQALFYIDMGRNDPKEMLARFCDNFTPPSKALPFFLKLVNGVVEHRSEIDEIIERFSSNWKISRMPCVDRNIIRIAAYEMFYCPDIPATVSINEAIDIGKKFGSEESGAFINGILDSIRMSLEKEQLKIKADLQSNETNY